MAPQLTPTPARLSSLSTTTLSQILELTRSQSLNLPSPSLRNSIQNNIAIISKGLRVLELEYSDELEEGETEEEVLEGLRAQWNRLVELVEGLGIEIEDKEGRRKGKGKGKSGKSKTGILVDMGDENLVDDDNDAEGDEEDGSLPLLPLNKGSKPSHTTITFPPPEDPAQARERLEEDEASIRRANAEVAQMQQQMIDDQDDTLTSLSSAISRQHLLSLQISEELDIQSDLLDSTDSAIDYTQNNLNRAGSRLKSFTQKAKDTGSTGLMVALVVVLVLLIIIFKS